MRVVIQTFALVLLLPTLTQAQPVVLVAGGDTAYPAGWFAKEAQRAGKRMYEPVQPLLATADLRFLNIESPVTTARPTAKKTYPLTTHPRFLKLLVEAGFNLFSLANNHTGDAGKKGLQDTFEHLKKHRSASRPIWWSGAGLTRAAREEPALFSLPGRSSPRIALLSFRLSGSPLANPMGGKGADEQVRAASRKADFVVVSAHGGGEYRNVPGGWKTARYRRFVDAGAHVVLGHGPHNPQGVERYKHGVIYYSLGNFSFGTKPPQRRTKGMLLRALMARVTFEKGRITRAEAIPLFVDNLKPWVVAKQKMPVRAFTPVPATGVHAAAMLDELQRWSRGIRGNRSRISACGAVYCIRAGGAAP